MADAIATGPVDGDLVATTAGTGFGIVCASLAPAALNACQQLGEELSTAYDGVALRVTRTRPPS